MIPCTSLTATESSTNLYAFFRLIDIAQLRLIRYMKYTITQKNSWLDELLTLYITKATFQRISLNTT